jgi:hypothetical protein
MYFLGKKYNLSITYASSSIHLKMTGSDGGIDPVLPVLMGLSAYLVWVNLSYKAPR